MKNLPFLGGVNFLHFYFWLHRWHIKFRRRGHVSRIADESAFTQVDQSRANHKDGTRKFSDNH